MAAFKKSGVTGDKELVAALRELSKGPTSKEVDDAALQSLQPMLRITRDRLRRERNFIGKWPDFFTQPKSPRKGGHVDEGIVAKKLSAKGKQSYYRLGATRRSRYLLHLLEFGTAPHFEPNFHGGWMHPGARAIPILIPTFDQEKGKVKDAFGQFIWSSMSRKIATLKKAPKR